jgi:YlmC/YmxH family sporulation protein
VVRMADLRDRDVVNVNDGKRLGIISDIEVDVERGRIRAIVIPGTGGFMGVLSRKHDLIISWDQIVKVGVDTILVDYPVDTILD